VTRPPPRNRPPPPGIQRSVAGSRGPELAANFAWSDADWRTLYLTAATGLSRIRLDVPGVRPGGAKL
jgi:hypothetical protein